MSTATVSTSTRQTFAEWYPLLPAAKRAAIEDNGLKLTLHRAFVAGDLAARSKLLPALDEVERALQRLSPAIRLLVPPSP